MKFKPLRLVYKFFARIVIHFFVPVAAIVALTGCAAIQVKLGMKVYLNKIPISSIQASQSDGHGMAAGRKISSRCHRNQTGRHGNNDARQGLVERPNGDAKHRQRQQKRRGISFP
jgi:hypothetical protein